MKLEASSATVKFWLKISKLPSKLRRFSANCSFFGQSFSVGHYPPIYQPPKGVYLLNIFVRQIGPGARSDWSKTHVLSESKTWKSVFYCFSPQYLYIIKQMKKPKDLITWAGLARLAELVSVCRDPCTFVKRNKNQLRNYMTTGSARLAEIPVSRCRDPG